MKKRWTAFFLAFLLGLGLTACGKTPGPDTNTDAPPSAAEDIRQQTFRTVQRGLLDRYAAREL